MRVLWKVEKQLHFFFWKCEFTHIALTNPGSGVYPVAADDEDFTGGKATFSRQLARRMGGDLTATSEGEGQGAQFKLFINLVENNET